MTEPEQPHFALCPWWNAGACTCVSMAESYTEPDGEPGEEVDPPTEDFDGVERVS